MYFKGLEFFPTRKYIYDSSKYKFALKLAKPVTHTIYFIRQDADKSLVYFIIENSQGFSHSSVVVYN